MSFAGAPKRQPTAIEHLRPHSSPTEPIVRRSQLETDKTDKPALGTLDRHSHCAVLWLDAPVTLLLQRIFFIRFATTISRGSIKVRKHSGKRKTTKTLENNSERLLDSSPRGRCGAPRSARGGARQRHGHGPASGPTVSPADLPSLPRDSRKRVKFTNFLLKCCPKKEKKRKRKCWSSGFYA